MKRPLDLLVGDNPFHGISHLSQERARTRPLNNQCYTEYGANILRLSLENGANGFMFSVDETTLSIIKHLSSTYNGDKMRLYAIVPYAYEYVRKSTQTGGVSGLLLGLTRDMVFSSNLKVIATNVGGLARIDLSTLLKTYVTYEMSRIKSVIGKNMRLQTIMLHEIITDMVLALNMKYLCKEYINFLGKKQVRAGFETRNFPYLVSKFREWGIDFSNLTLTSAFNKVGFQMCPSQQECVESLKHARDAEIIAMSVLAAGYLKPSEAIEYVSNLKGISGLVIGVSKEQQATETFRLFSKMN
ncbi:MAG: hypothetical protein WDA42_05040 [Candidatus Bathyarchaeia archaeon]